MESSKKPPSTSVYFHIHGTTLLNPHYDNPVSKGLSATIKFFASLGLSDVMTSGAGFELIHFGDKKLDKIKSIHNFKKYYEAVTQGNEDRMLVQWSGDLGQTAWIEVAKAMESELDRRLSLLPEGAVLDVHGTYLSNGAQIVRLLAEQYLGDPRVRFHVLTVEAPLSLMPDNVVTWVQCYCEGDSIMRYGTFLMEAEKQLSSTMFSSELSLALGALVYMWVNNLYKERLEDAFFDATYKKDPWSFAFSRSQEKKLPPERWRSCKLPLSYERADKTIVKISDKHNDPMRVPECGVYMSEKMLESLGETQQLTPSIKR